MSLCVVCRIKKGKHFESKIFSCFLYDSIYEGLLRNDLMSKLSSFPVGKIARQKKV